MQVALTLGERLKDLRIEKGLTAEQAANAMGMSQGVLSEYENDKKLPGYEKLKSLTSFYDVSYDYLFCETNSRKRTNIDIGKRLGFSDNTIQQIDKARRNGFIDIEKCFNLLCDKSIFDTVFENLDNFFDLEANVQLHSVIQDELCNAYYLDVGNVFLESITGALKALRNELLDKYKGKE